MQAQKETVKKTAASNQTKAVATKTNSALVSSDVADINSSWGAEEATSNDIIIPKLLLMHGLSKEVAAGNKLQGDLIRSTTLETLAKKGEKLKVIPFIMTKTWRISDISENPPRWKRDEIWNATNDESPWEFEETDPRDGKNKKMRRDKAYNFYAMVVSDIDKGGSFPVRLQFLRTSSQAGRAIADHFAKARMFQKPPAQQMWEVSSELVTGPKPYFKFVANPSTNTTELHLQECKNWFDTIKGNGSKIKEHDVDEADESAVTKDEF